jgi:flagellar biosynthesis/type III secretory pathway protein FliH
MAERENKEGMEQGKTKRKREGIAVGLKQGKTEYWK